MATAAVTGTDDIRTRAQTALARCGADLAGYKGDAITARTPITGAALFGLRATGTRPLPHVPGRLPTRNGCGTVG